MSFMFNPYDYVDPQAVNRPHLPAALGAEVSVCSDKVARRLLEKTPEQLSEEVRKIFFRFLGRTD